MGLCKLINYKFERDSTRFAYQSLPRPQFFEQSGSPVDKNTMRISRYQKKAQGAEYSQHYHFFWFGENDPACSCPKKVD